jgi:archaellin
MQYQAQSSSPTLRAKASLVITMWIMALCSIVASFLVNAAFALATKSRDTLTPGQKSVACALTRSRRLT